MNTTNGAKLVLEDMARVVAAPLCSANRAGAIEAPHVRLFGFVHTETYDQANEVAVEINRALTEARLRLRKKWGIE